MTDAVPEAQLRKTDAGLVPQGEGWFVLNAREVSWIRSEERGQDTDFQGGQEWSDLGFRIQILSPGQRGLYHGERGQEDFLVVSGECVLVIEGQERRLKAWDFVHCPPWTKHAFVGGGDGPCVIVMVGSRAGGFEVVYAMNDVAAKYDASVLKETSKPDEAHARLGPEKRRRTGRGCCLGEYVQVGAVKIGTTSTARPGGVCRRPSFDFRHVLLKLAPKDRASSVASRRRA